MSRRHIQLMIIACVFALVATACAGESTSTEESPSTTAAEAESPEVTDPPPEGGDDGDGGDSGGEEPAEPTESEAEPAFAEDFHGGVFADFQASFDRNSDPFTSLEALCLPHEAAADRTDSMRGITADTIEVGHMRNKLEDAVALGFGIPVGDPHEMFELFIGYINEECGGIRGRQLELSLGEFSPLDQSAEALTSACLAVTEDAASVVVMNSTGYNATGALCVAEEHETVMIGGTGLASDIIERGEGRILSTQQTLGQASKNLVNKAVADGILDGTKIAVVYPDTPGIPEVVEGELIPALDAAGFSPAVTEVVGCDGGTVCAAGLVEVVGKLKGEEITAVFAPFNILSLPGFVQEMATQGFAPGEVTFLQSNFNSQAGDLVSSKVAANGGVAAAELYNGAYIVDSAYTGLHNVTDTVPPFNQMCLDTYAGAGGNGGAMYDYFSQVDNTPAGMVGSVCSQIRLMARILYHAGDNPTPESILEAIKNMGPIDISGMLPGKVDGGTNGAEFWVQSLRWTFPCEYPEPYDENDTCIVSSGDYTEGVN